MSGGEGKDEAKSDGLLAGAARLVEEVGDAVQEAAETLDEKVDEIAEAVGDHLDYRAKIMEERENAAVSLLRDLERAEGEEEAILGQLEAGEHQPAEATTEECKDSAAKNGEARSRFAAVESVRKKWERGETVADEAWNAHSHALASHATATVNVKETMEVFHVLDKNADGSISVEELLEAGKSVYVRRLLQSTNNFVLTSLIRSEAGSTHAGVGGFHRGVVACVTGPPYQT